MKGIVAATLVGKTFGSLTVTSVHDSRHVISKCVCGKSWTVRARSIVSGITTSCGCVGRARMRQANVTHGLSKSNIYKVWEQMRARCNDPAAASWKYYGAKGIRVCPRWDSVQHFSADMGKRPPGTTLDRIDPFGNYEPGNCRWATRTQQARNRGDTKHISFAGKRQCVADWAEELGADAGLIARRLRSGWAVEDALLLPAISPGRTRKALEAR